VALPVCNTPARAPKSYTIRCIIIKGIESWFITGNTNDPESSPFVGWFQVLQGYIPEDWTSRQEAFIEAEGEKARRTIQEAMDERTY
jgi:hypothetical protein